MSHGATILTLVPPIATMAVYAANAPSPSSYLLNVTCLPFYFVCFADLLVLWFTWVAKEGWEASCYLVVVLTTNQRLFDGIVPLL